MRILSVHDQIHLARGVGFTGLAPITQISGFCFDTQGNVHLLRQTEVPGKNWNIPGGHPEPGETPDQTLEREIFEETTVRIGEHGFIGYQEVLNDSDQTQYQLRFAAIITDIEPQQIDPAKGVIHKLRDQGGSNLVPKNGSRSADPPARRLRSREK